MRPLTSAPWEIYIPDLTARRLEIGSGVASGSTYVIAELDGAYTKYREVTVESEWRAQRAFVRGSYTFSKYWGNFDQDNTTIGNDMNTFIGSSLTADGPGRQLWNFRDGRLRGDRPHMFKLYGYLSAEMECLDRRLHVRAVGSAVGEHGIGRPISQSAGRTATAACLSSRPAPAGLTRTRSWTSITHRTCRSAGSRCS